MSNIDKKCEHCGSEQGKPHATRCPYYSLARTCPHEVTEMNSVCYGYCREREAVNA